MCLVLAVEPYEGVAREHREVVLERESGREWRRGLAAAGLAGSAHDGIAVGDQGARVARTGRRLGGGRGGACAGLVEAEVLVVARLGVAQGELDRERARHREV